LVLGITLTDSNAAIAQVYASRVEAQLLSAVPGSLVSPYMTGNNVDSQAASTNPITATFSQRNESSENFVDHTITSSASFAGTTRGRLTHTYESTFANPSNRVDFEFARNQDITNLLELIPFGQVDFTANSDVLSGGFATTSSASPASVDLVRSNRISLYRERETLPGEFLLAWTLRLPTFNGEFQIDLVRGDNYRLSVEPTHSIAFGAINGFSDYAFDMVWTTDGSTQDNPVLPDLTLPGQFAFENVPSGLWYDPILANGYDFQTTDGSLFTSILDLPTGFSDRFTVTTDGNVLGEFGPGESVDFGSGVSSFSISGINPGTDPNDNLAFPIQLAFDTSIASFTMTPVVVPEPTSSLACLAMGTVALARRRRSYRHACRGVMVESRYKTFLATSQVVGGEVRVVLVEHSRGNWAAYIGTDPAMSVDAILQLVSDRWAIEEHFHDVKEVWGAGQQQVRNVWSSIGCWNLCGWLYGMVESECWDDPTEQLVDRRDRPWDNPTRRPSHADRRRRIARQMLRKEFLNDLNAGLNESKIQDRFERLLSMAA